MGALIELDDVTRVYDTGTARAALTNLTLQIEEGDFAAVMGPSGSGKSTLLNLVAGLDRPTSGRVVVDGCEVGRMSESALARFRRRRVGFVFQFFNLLPSLTVLENILVPAQLAWSRPAAAAARARELLERLGIQEVAARYPARLSGGQQQRVAIARALINTPRVLLADEPTGALDSSAGAEVMRLLQDLHGEGQTVVLVTHDAKLATRHARRVISLLDGRLLDDTRLAVTTADPQDLVRVTGREVAG
ncbi:MAG TPA: ABC transporter ATP-binding protein [Candidatus Dormibacteraeota bacterium]|nr:ABC transporter ATP-binding protein [Candidatus Dormibacteraeota bacterium]